MSGRSLLATGLAVLVSAGAVAAIARDTPTAHPVTGHHVTRPATAVTLSCPGVPSGTPASGPAVTTTVSAVAPGISSASGSGRVDVVDPAGDATLASGETRGTVFSATIGGPGHATSADAVAEGALAPGLQAAETVVGVAGAPAHGKTAATPPTGSSSTAWCLAPRADWWFTGADTSVDSTSTLVLTNPGPSVAVVALDLYGAHGRVRALGAEAIALAPHTRREYDLARWAPGQAALSVHAAVSRGAVTAAVLVQRVAGATPAGSDWLPPSAAPGRTVVVGAGLAGRVDQTLLLANPGDRQQVVTVRVLSATGAFTSTGLPPVQVPPGTVVTRSLASVTAHGADALELSAHGLVTGAVESRLTSGSHDFAFSGVVQPLPVRPDQPTVVPTLTGSALALAFTVAGTAPASVRVDGFAADGSSISSSTVSLPGSSTTLWHAPAAPSSGSSSGVDDAPTAYYTVSTLSGGIGAVAAVAQYSRVDGLAELSLVPSVWTVTLPAVLP